MAYSISDTLFIKTVQESSSIREVLLKLGLAAAGGNYKTIHNRIKKLSLSTIHFTGQGSNKGRSFGPKRELKEYLSNQFPIHSHKLRLRLIKEGIFEAKCYSCNLSSWLEKEIPLELEHINGNHMDNSLSNLILLCPNCHAQTSTYRGKNKSHKDKITKTFIKNESDKCIDCLKEIHRKSIRCKECDYKLRRDRTKSVFKITWPSIEELKEKLQTSNYSKLARELGVSDNAIRKHINKNS